MAGAAAPHPPPAPPHPPPPPPHPGAAADGAEQGNKVMSVDIERYEGKLNFFLSLAGAQAPRSPVRSPLQRQLHGGAPAEPPSTATPAGAATAACRHQSPRHSRGCARQPSAPPGRPDGDSVADAISSSLLEKASPFGWFKMCQMRDEECRVWNNMAVNPRKTFPYSKRLAHVFLSLLGRSPEVEHTDEAVPAVLDVVLRPDSALCKALQGTATEEELGQTITLNADTINRVCKEEVDAGHFPDKIWESYCIEGGWDKETRTLKDPCRADWLPVDQMPYGADASKVYGGKDFSVTVGELVELEKSIRIATSSELPAEFFSQLMAFTTKDKKHQRFFDIRRSLPLKDIGKPDLWAQQHLDIGQIWRDRLTVADAKVKELRETRRKLLEELAACPKDDRALKSEIMETRWDISKGWCLEDCDFELEDNVVVRDNAKVKVERLGCTEFMEEENRIAAQFGQWMDRVLQEPQAYGFVGRASNCCGTSALVPSPPGAAALQGARAAAKLSLTEICTMMCMSTKGYFFVDGCGAGFEDEFKGKNRKGDGNQLTEKTPQQIVFLCSAGVDFCEPSSAKLEKIKYFNKVPSPDGGEDIFKGFKEGAGGDGGQLMERLKRLYRVIFRSCEAQNVQNPSMIAMGMGVFLSSVDKEDKDKVKEAYFRAQWQLLCEHDWGFQNYFLNPAMDMPAAKRTLLDEIEKCRSEGKPSLRCNIVLHNRDVKFLATEMAKCADKYPGPAYLNPSDCASTCLGLMGYFWELGRASNYVGEEDFACTSTAILARTGITSSHTDLERYIQPPPRSY